MTEISFHFNVPDKLAYACRLLRKAVNGGNKVVVAGETQALTQLDAALWTFSPLDFLPHCFTDNTEAIVSVSPILLGYPAASTSSATLPAQVLLNLGQTSPDGFERFERLIELVGLDDEDRQAARYRWKHYAGRGYEITRHDLASSPPA